MIVTEMDLAKFNEIIETDCEIRAREVGTMLILKLIFRHCSGKELKICRLVIKDWHEVSLSHWTQKAVVVLVPDTDEANQSVAEDVTVTRPNTVSKFLEQVHGDKKPFSDHARHGIRQLDKFILNGFVIGYDSCDIGMCSPFGSVLERCGQHIRSLTLRNLVVSDHHGFRHFRDIVLAKGLPKLTDLNVEVSIEYNDEGTLLENCLFYGIFYVGPNGQRDEHLNLKRLTCVFRKHPNGPGFLSHAVPRGALEKRFPNLQELSVTAEPA